jgi:WD40 repeat protein
MQGRRLGNWLKQRQEATLDYTEPEPVAAGETPGAEWEVDAEVLRAERRRRVRWAIAVVAAVLIVGTGAYLLVRSATAYKRLVDETFSKNIAYIEYQPFANSAFIKVEDPSLFVAIRDWFAEADPQDKYTQLAKPTCQLRVVYADGTSKVLLIDPTGPSAGPDGTVVPPTTALPIEVDGHKRWANAHPFHMAVYANLPKERQLATSALPTATFVPGRVTATAFGAPEQRAVSPYDAAMDAAKQLVEAELHGQALVALKEAQRWMPESAEAQELAAIARSQIRFEAPRVRERVAAVVGESGERFANRATYHQVRSDVLKVAWMFPPDDPEVRGLRERLMKRRPPAEASRFKEVRRLAGEPSDLQPVRTLLWSPDGTRIAASCSDRLIRLWDATTGHLLHRISAEAVEAIAFSADGRYLLAGKEDLTEISRAERVWDVVTCEAVVAVERDQPVAMTSFGQPDGITTTSTEFGELELRDGNTQHVIHTLAAHAGPVRLARFSSDGDVLLTFGDDKAAILWSDGPADASAPFDENRFRSMRRLATLPAPGAFAPDGKIVVPYTADAAAAPWDRSLKLVPLKLDEPPRRWRLSPDGKLLFVVTGSGEGVAYDVEARAERSRFRPPTAEGDVAFSPDGKLVAHGQADGSVRVVDVATGSEHRLLTSKVAPPKWSSVRFSGDGRLLMGHEGTSCAVWEVATGVNWFHTDRLASAEEDAAVLSPDGKLLAVARTRAMFEIITTDTFDSGVNVHRAAGTSFSFSADGRLLAAADAEGVVAIHDASTGAFLQALTVGRANGDGGGARPLRAMLFSADGNTLLVDPADGSLRLFDVTAGTELRRLAWPEALGKPHPLSFGPDSQRVLTGAVLWATRD